MDQRSETYLSTCACWPHRPKESAHISHLNTLLKLRHYDPHADCVQSVFGIFRRFYRNIILCISLGVENQSFATLAFTPMFSVLDNSPKETLLNNSFVFEYLGSLINTN